MFERYTERARRVIFFARYEASTFGSTVIDTDHLLLGILREEATLPARFAAGAASRDVFIKDLHALMAVKEKVPTSIDLPLSDDARRALAYAAEEAERLQHRFIGHEHFVLAILRLEGTNAAEVLKKHGLQLEAMREKLAQAPPTGDELPRVPLAHFNTEGKRLMLNHMLASIAYRVQKALRGAPERFGEFCAAPQVRTPHQVVCHMINVLRYARTFLTGRDFPRHLPTNFRSDVNVFHDALEDIKLELTLQTPLKEMTAERLLQGPLSDVMTHAGQLAMLRRLAGSPVPPEDFIKAAIDAENLSPDQPAPASPDERSECKPGRAQPSRDEDWPERP